MSSGYVTYGEVFAGNWLWSLSYVSGELTYIIFLSAIRKYQGPFDIIHGKV